MLPCAWGRMAQVLPADENYDAVKFCSGSYLASGMKTTVQIPNKTQPKVSRDRQVAIICLSHKEILVSLLCIPTCCYSLPFGEKLVRWAGLKICPIRSCKKIRRHELHRKKKGYINYIPLMCKDTKKPWD